MANIFVRILTPAALIALVSNAWAGIHIGNIYLRTVDDNSPYILMSPENTPKLALRDCNNSAPVIFTAEYDGNGLPYFDIDDAAPSTICQIGVYLGGTLDLKVDSFVVANVEPAPIGLTLSPTSLSSLVGGTIRAGTTTMASNVRAIAAVPRTATQGETEQIEAALSSLAFQYP